MAETPAGTPIMDAWGRLPLADRLRLYYLDIRINGVWYALTHLGRLPMDPETLSHAFAVRASEGDPLGVQACLLLERVDPGHCERVLRLGDHPPAS